MISQDLKNLRSVIDRRSFVFGSLQGLAFAVLAGRLYYLQIVKGEHYTVLSDKNRVQLRLLIPKRGTILDRRGAILAGNRDSYSVFAERGSEESLQKLTPFIRPRRSGNGMATDNLNWEQVARLSAIAPDLPGVTIGKSHLRTYPLGRAAAHVIGHIGRSSQPRLPPNFKVGKSGVERKLENILAGDFGSKKVEVDALGREIRDLENTPPSVGRGIELTLDARLQRRAHALFKGLSGATVMLDCRNGEVLLSYSSPSFAPEALAHGAVSLADWRRLADNFKNPLLDRALDGIYAPGSVFKVIVAMAALRKGIATPNTSYFCPGYLEYGNRRFHCWREEGHHRLDLSGAIKHSCDVYFYQLARKVGIADISAMAEQIGLGEKVNVWPLQGRGGLMPTPKWKKRAKGQSWLVSDTMMTAIGQGYVLTTPMQLALTAAWFASGRRVHPYLLVGDAPKVKPIRTDSHLEFMRNAMFKVVNEAGGTAYGGRIREADYAMAGKTGTSQVRAISIAERRNRILKNEELSWHQRDHALFIGYAPVARPLYAISVVLEHGGSSSAAVPIAAELLDYAQRNEVVTS